MNAWKTALICALAALAPTLAACTAGGAVAGGYGGHVAENYYSRDTQYRVNVRMDNGTNRSFTYKAAPGFQAGERVHIENGTLVAG